MGLVPMKGAGYLAHSYKAYSLARKGTKIKLSLPLKDVPLWHSTIFCNKHNNTYFAPQEVLYTSRMHQSVSHGPRDMCHRCHTHP